MDYIYYLALDIVDFSTLDNGNIITRLKMFDRETNLKTVKTLNLVKNDREK